MNKKDFIYDSPMRKNVVVMGDIISDSRMVDDSQHEITIKIGFLNNREKHGHMIEDYLKVYDMVVMDDGTLLPAAYLLTRLINDQEIDKDMARALVECGEFEVLESLFK
jgi:hypothetical protein